MNPEPSYLGNGVYVQLTACGQVLLTTGSHREDEARDVIYLEPEIVRRLMEYLKPGPGA